MSTQTTADASHAQWVWRRGEWPRCATCGKWLPANDIDDADEQQNRHAAEVTR